MGLTILLIIFQTAVITSLANGYYGDSGCTGFTYDTSSLEDDSDYQVDASGSNNYDVGGTYCNVVLLAYNQFIILTVLWSPNSVNCSVLIVIYPCGL